MQPLTSPQEKMSLLSNESYSPAIKHIPIEITHNPIKRGLDIGLSICAITIIFPFFIIIGAIIKLTSSGSVFYSQPRVGQGGKIFTCYKFRSMSENADTELQNILSKDEKLKIEWENTGKLKADPRITVFGSLLRRSSLDELPQFINVLKGDLSVVGPRPFLPKEVETHFKKEDFQILSVRPGLTGLWQISRGTNRIWENRIALDNEYIKNQSMGLDLQLIVLTVPYIIFLKNV